MYILGLSLPAYATPPIASLPYQRSVIREVRAQWGLNGPVSVMAGQIEQESAWNPQAKSNFAAGLAEFTPQTAAWISGAFPKELGSNQPYNPEWAIRALSIYDHELYGGIHGSAEECTHWAFTLSAYNGGSGWISRDRGLARASGADPDVWFGQTERFTSRSPGASKENRGYPRRILLSLQAHYSTWGPEVSCPISKAS